MRKSDVFFLFIAAMVVFTGWVAAYASMQKRENLNSLQKKIDLVKELSLSDLCLVTEAGYTRHLSQGDLYTPFQDGPLALEHFPSGSLMPPHTRQEWK